MNALKTMIADSIGENNLIINHQLLPAQIKMKSNPRHQRVMSQEVFSIFFILQSCLCLTLWNRDKSREAIRKTIIKSRSIIQIKFMAVNNPVKLHTTVAMIEF